MLKRSIVPVLAAVLLAIGPSASWAAPADGKAAAKSSKTVKVAGKSSKRAKADKAGKAVRQARRSSAGKARVASSKKGRSLIGSRSDRKRSSIAYKSQESRSLQTSYAATGILNMRHAKDTARGRMSTAADLSKDTVKNFGRRAAAKYGSNTIVISNYTRRLYYISRRGKVISYPIATPRPNEIWTGVTRISDKKVNPDWYPTPDMREQDPDLPEKVDGGTPSNPLGARALYLGNSVYRIHGTNNPKSIGSPASGGCYRMKNSNVIALYSMVGVGTKVVVTNSRGL